jgi:hypothetical protein
MATARRPNDFLQDRIAPIVHEHGELTADLTVKLYKVPTGRTFRLDRVSYINPTGLAAHADNYFVVKVRVKSTTVAAQWSTQTTGGTPGGQGTLTANTFVELVPVGADTNRVASGGDEISVFYDEFGTATLPAGRLVLEGRFV